MVFKINDLDFSVYSGIRIMLLLSVFRFHDIPRANVVNNLVYRKI